MKVLFVHNNFPAQFRNVVEAIREMGGFELAAIGAESAPGVEGVTIHRYTIPPIDVSRTHPFSRRFDAECSRAEHVLMAASALGSSGFVPDFIIAHCGWGEALPLRALFPKARPVVVNGVGHWVHSEAPEVVTETLRRVLRLLPGS